VGLCYDKDGKLAAKGQVDRELLDAWMDDPYFHEAAAEDDGPRALRHSVRAARDDRVARHGNGGSDRDRHRIDGQASRAYHDFVAPHGRSIR
jgi:1,6-anhydro-N-acetylmuramate kinase